MSAWESAIRGNIDYYQDHPSKYKPEKIDRETWIPRSVRERMKQELDILTGEKARREATRREFFAQAQTVKAQRKKRYILGFAKRTDKPFKYDKKMHRFAKLTKTDRRTIRRLQKERATGPR